MNLPPVQFSSVQSSRSVVSDSLRPLSARANSYVLVCGGGGGWSPSPPSWAAMWLQGCLGCVSGPGAGRSWVTNQLGPGHHGSPCLQCPGQRHVSKPHLLLSVWEGKGPDYSCLGLSASVSTGRAFHPPVGDEELEGSSVTLGWGISDTAAASSGSVPTACVYQGPTGHPSTAMQVEACTDV